MRYDINFSCGHEGTINLYGPNKERERRLEWYKADGLCPECYKKWREREKIREAEENKKKAQSYEAPDLSGSEKQIAWAEKIRAEFIEKLERGIARYDEKREDENKEVYTSEREFILSTFTEMLKDKEEAGYWIDNRDENLDTLLEAYITEKNKKEEENTPVAREAKKEITMIPENKKHDGTAIITVSGDTVFAKYERNDDFIKIVKSRYMRWNRERWERTCNTFSGGVLDRAAELINTLLRNGFAVSCTNAEARRKAQSADFKPECRKWLSLRKKENCLALTWDKSDELYNAAHNIAGAKWNRDYQKMLIPDTSWREAIDFANINGFCISPGAKRKIEECKNAEIKVVPVQPQKPKNEDKLKKILQNKEIPNDLKDD